MINFQAFYEHVINVDFHTITYLIFEDFIH